MPGLTTSLKLVDQMTAPILAINNAINLMTARFNALEQATDIDAASLTAMRNQINLANSATLSLGKQHYFHLFGAFKKTFRQNSQKLLRQNSTNSNIFFTYCAKYTTPTTFKIFYIYT